MFFDFENLKNTTYLFKKNKNKLFRGHSHARFSEVDLGITSASNSFRERRLASFLKQVLRLGGTSQLSSTLMPPGNAMATVLPQLV